jgi:hypothetical protein
MESVEEAMDGFDPDNAKSEPLHQPSTKSRSLGAEREETSHHTTSTNANRVATCRNPRDTMNGLRELSRRKPEFESPWGHEGERPANPRGFRAVRVWGTTAVRTPLEPISTNTPELGNKPV